jgi:hypothetical protein
VDSSNSFAVRVDMQGLIFGINHKLTVIMQFPWIVGGCVCARVCVRSTRVVLS